MNETNSIRVGEELNRENLQNFLDENLNLIDQSLEIEQFPAGSSNLTYAVKIGVDEYVLRRPPFGNTVKSAHDMKREFDVLEKLSKVYQPAPAPLIYCADDGVIGSEFYLTERRHGLIIRGKSPEILENSAKLPKKVCESFIENLANFHALDYKEIRLGDLGKPRAILV